MDINNTLVFDYDGTIHETLNVYEPVLRQCISELIKEGFELDESISSKRIAGFLGINAKDMWLDYAPDLTQDQRDYASFMVGTNMERLVREGKASWYKGARQTLDYLKNKGYRMVILSNSKKRTGEYHFEAFNMGQWFDKWYDCESYCWAPKKEIVREIIKDYSENLILIGDRYSDIEAASEIGITSVGCLYGYGSKEELSDASYLINDISELKDIL